VNDQNERRVLELRVPVESAEEASALRAALLTARASELAEVRRRGGRLSFGYGSDSARDSMRDEVDRGQLRYAMVERLLGALDAELNSGG